MNSKDAKSALDKSPSYFFPLRPPAGLVPAVPAVSQSAASAASIVVPVAVCSASDASVSASIAPQSGAAASLAVVSSGYASDGDECRSLSSGSDTEVESKKLEQKTVDDNLQVAQAEFNKASSSPKECKDMKLEAILDGALESAQTAKRAASNVSNYRLDEISLLLGDIWFRKADFRRSSHYCLEQALIEYRYALSNFLRLPQFRGPELVERIGELEKRLAENSKKADAESKEAKSGHKEDARADVVEFTSHNTLSDFKLKK